tara:strand:+ start:734 stop:1246 length:513 start_codon:yes stop_codon:yes gene_type:complete
LQDLREHLAKTQFQQKMTIQIGDTAPEIDLTDQNGISRKTSQLKAKNLVIFFYPKDDTPVCTTEACSFRDQYKLIKQLNSEVWGISADDEVSHLNFSNKNKIPYPLLVDKGNILRNLFGVPKSLIFLPGRVTYILDKNRKVINIINNILDAQIHIDTSIRTLKQIKSDSQ